MDNFTRSSLLELRTTTSVAALAVVILSAIPSGVALVAQKRRNLPKDNFYEDVDGKSSPEAVADFSNTRPKAAISVCAVATFATSLAVSVLETLDTSLGLSLPSWIVTAAFAVILLQTISIVAQRSPVKSHNLGRWAFLSSVVSLPVVALQLRDNLHSSVSQHNPVLILRLINVILSVCLAIGSLCLPRRPDVFIRDQKVHKQVDRQFTVSVLSRNTWSWIWPLIKKAIKQGDLEEKDIPQPDHYIQVDFLLSEWHSAQYTSTLAWSLFRAYRARLFLQWAVIIIRCLVGIGPFYIMLRLISSLDYKVPGEWPSSAMWGYVFWLGLLSLTENWLNGWIMTQCVNMVSLPVRAQLSALIFEKSMKRKSVKAAEKTEEVKPEAEGVEAVPSEEDTTLDTNKNDGAKADTKDEDSVLKSRQAIVNLVGVDVGRISNFVAYSFHIVLSIGQLVVYTAFLVQLLGWIPTAAGILAWALVLPFNTKVSKLHMKATEGLMKSRDKKLAVVNEALLGMRQIKFAALEKQWEARITSWREKELGQLWKIFQYDVLLISCWVFSPIMLAVASLAAYSLLNETLTPSVAFVSIGVFRELEVTLGALPALLTAALDTIVSVRRVEKYLQGPEMKKVISEGPDVAFENANIAWPVDDDVPDEERFILNNLNLSFPAGELSVISGKTGTGKSLLLSAILGEVDLLEGSIYAPATKSPLERHDDAAHPGNWILPGSVAYVSQIPWLESASLRDNILFGLPFIEERYNTVVGVCALKKDLAILTDGDKTELGANGINLSGGQKWRITLARAIYSRAEILVMDDIFSAVDAHVGRQIFEKCIGGKICHNRTRILVTHHVGLVQSKAKYLVELGEGTVTHAGLVTKLAEDGTLNQIKSHEQSEVPEVLTEDTTAVNSEDASIDNDETENSLQKAPSQDAKRFIEEEKREKGMVKSRVYGVFFREAGGILAWGVCLLCFFAAEAGDLGRAWWLKIWTGDGDIKSTATNTYGESGYGPAYTLHHSMGESQNTMSVISQDRHDLSYYLWVYVAISAATAFVSSFRFYWVQTMSLKASRTLFRRILWTVLRTPLRWLDTVPVGRVLNRMTADFDIIDQRVAGGMAMMVWNVLALLSVCVAGLLVSAYIVPMAAILIAVATYVAKLYMDGARPLKRLESTSKSPVFELFNAALSGMQVLRASQKTGDYVKRLHRQFDLWDSISLQSWIVNRWFGIRMSAIGALFTTAMGLIVILSPGIDGAMGGFTLSFAVNFSLSMLIAIRFYSQLELDMNATERVIEYTELKMETQEGEKPPAAWPSSGSMEVEDLVVAYAEDLDPVLKGISFDVKANERIGVVGRTGAGKSSLTLALFRFIESRSGKVTIDGLDISKIDLHSLRSRLAIIPQDPVLFSGTIRSNIDPFDDHTDDALRDCLARVHLLDSVAPTPVNEPSSAAGSAAASTAAAKNANIFKDLSSPIAESGGNLSQGQRQLLCLARAIISRPKIMVLDEATSAVDMATDALIQRSIREEFTSSTLLVIAHRLSTIADFDRILVLDEGKVAEFGTPKELWDREGGIFRDMCESSGEKEKLEATIFGKI